jgi:hypothetical protein
LYNIIYTLFDVWGSFLKISSQFSKNYQSSFCVVSNSATDFFFTPAWLLPTGDLDLTITNLKRRDYGKYA